MTYSVYDIKIDNSLAFTAGPTAGWVLAIESDGSTTWSEGGFGATGATGATGPEGPIGPEGPTGATGATGSLTQELFEVYIDPNGVTASFLEENTNWSNGVYGGTAISGTLQGQKHFEAPYSYEAVDDNNWIRYEIGDNGVESVGPNVITGIWSGTQSQYDALGTYSTNIIYFIEA
jgi:hypothetical protein